MNPLLYRGLFSFNTCFLKKAPYFHLTNLGKLRSDLIHHETNAEANTQIIHKSKAHSREFKKHTKSPLLFTEIQSDTYTQLNNYQTFIVNIHTQFKETDGQNNPISLRHYPPPFIILSWHNHFVSTSKSFSILSTLPVSNSNYSRSTLLFVEKRLLLHTDTPVPWQPSPPSSPECMPTSPSSVQQFPTGPSQTTYNRADRKE